MGDRAYCTLEVPATCEQKTEALIMQNKQMNGFDESSTDSASVCYEFHDVSFFDCPIDPELRAAGIPFDWTCEPSSSNYGTNNEETRFTDTGEIIFHQYDDSTDFSVSSKDILSLLEQKQLLKLQRLAYSSFLKNYVIPLTDPTQLKYGKIHALRLVVSSTDIEQKVYYKTPRRMIPRDLRKSWLFPSTLEK